MAEDVEHTVAWYDRNAADFARQTGDLDLSPLYDRFLANVRHAGRLLDAGCGVGRDALAFTERGYEVVAFDASVEMVRFARIRAGGRFEAHLMRFEDVRWHAEFDGIWSCASLLHVPDTDFPAAAARLAAALRPGGAWYMSFKSGPGQRVAGCRLFVDHTEESLLDALASISVRVSDVWITSDVRRGRENEHWLNLIAIK